MTEAATRAFTVGPIELRAAAVSDIGLKRRLNEDAVLARGDLYLVADGMGGYEAGDEASRAVVAAFAALDPGRPFLTLEAVRAGLEAADEGVSAVADGTTRGAGSTVAGAAIVDADGEPNWLIFNVGDSRVYRHYDGVLQQVTVDHSLGQELYAAGRITAEELAVFPDRNVITRAIGAVDAEADSWLMPVRVGERLLLCSDGLTVEVPDAGIRDALNVGGAPDAIATRLVELAKVGGGRDNVSVVVVEVLSGAAEFDHAAALATPALVAAPDDGDTTLPVAP